MNVNKVGKPVFWFFMIVFFVANLFGIPTDFCLLGVTFTGILLLYFTLEDMNDGKGE